MVKMGAQLVSIGVGAVGLGMVALLPTARLITFSPRADATLAMLNEFALPPVQLLTLVLPYLFGHPKLQPLGYWGMPTFEEMFAYVGVLPLVALALTPALAKRGAKVGYWVAWVIVGYSWHWGAMGDSSRCWCVGCRALICSAPPPAICSFGRSACAASWRGLSP